ncbi:MAG: YeeE/YedE family protein [Rhizobiales bacterium]|nr:YeeE/YedE family protein [Hyphomicrobiales bacterium]
MQFGWVEAGVERLGAGPALLAAGLLAGLTFGFCAQRSRFCLRAAVVEFSTGRFGEKLAIWLLTFGTAITLVQWLAVIGDIDPSQSRALSATGSLTGAVSGGLLFGIGMVLARGCASRLLVLSATGNARALIAGLIFVVTAQAAYQGVLAPARMAISGLWTIDGGAARSLLAQMGARPEDGLILAFLWLVAAIRFASRAKLRPLTWITGAGAGAAVAFAYWITARIGLVELEPGTLRGITFSGPSTEILMRVLGGISRPPGFDTGLVPGVFLGAALGAVVGGEWRLQVFDQSSGTLRYIIGAALMGFGAMLAGGCAVGAGISGGAIFSLTAWIALTGMWLGAGLTHWLVDERHAPEPATGGSDDGMAITHPSSALR